MAQDVDALPQFLADGWVIAGYSTCIMAAGAMVHCILLQKETRLVTFTIGLAGQREIDRHFVELSPTAAPNTEGNWFR